MNEALQSKTIKISRLSFHTCAHVYFRELTTDLKRGVRVFRCFYNYINLYCIASQFKSLIRILPFAIGNYVEEFDEHWQLLWDICNIALAFEVTEEDADICHG